uniref:Uncharacterized protein n=1 Tax=Gossypium raimondii TaxID=29730 RepID=A0A0D2SWE9_GOSRA|nr:hypothetical protein B456_007G364500 [Gossypium raimondii]
MALAPSSVFFGRFFIGFILCAQLLKLFSPTYFNYLYGSTSTNFAQVDVIVESTRSVIIPTSFRCKKKRFWLSSSAEHGIYYKKQRLYMFNYDLFICQNIPTKQK